MVIFVSLSVYSLGKSHWYPLDRSKGPIGALWRRGKSVSHVYNRFPIPLSSISKPNYYTD